MAKRRRPAPLYTRRELATKLSVDAATITRWRQDGLPVAVAGGGGLPARYDLAAVIAWRDARAAEKRAQPGVASLEQQRARVANFQAERIELEVQRLRGELVDKAEVARVWAQDSIAIRARLRAIPKAIAPALVEAAVRGPAAVQRVLADAIDEALRELADSVAPSAAVTA